MLAIEDARKIAYFLQDKLEPACEDGYCVPAGGFRRRKSWLHDLEFVVKPNNKPAPLVLVTYATGHLIRTGLDMRLYALEQSEFLYFEQGEAKNQKYYINLARFGLASTDDFKLDLWITTPPAQFGVNLAIRTGPASDENEFTKWMVTPRSHGGALPDGYRVKHCAVWKIDQLNEKGNPKPGEEPLAMPNESDFLNFIGVTEEPENRRAQWKKYL